MTPNVLVVDDAQTVVHAAQSMLEVNRIQRDDIVTAHTAADALQLFHEHAPDLVFLDVELPDMDGLELARALQEADPEARIVAVTGLSPQDRRVRRLMEDPDVDVVDKPLEHSDLEELGVLPEPPT